MPLPVPSEYSDWRDWASAMLRVLGSGASEVVAGGVSVTTPTAPPGYAPLWLNLGLPELVSGNVYGSAPTAADIVFIDTAEIAAAAITGTLIAPGAVGTSHILDAAIVTAKIGDLQVVNAKIADLAVNNAKIANLAVASANIMDAAINNAKIGALAVGAANIIDLAVVTAKIGLLAVTAAQLADATITSAKIGAAQITTALIANAAIVQALIAAAAIGSAQIQDAAIGSAKITDLVVDKITAGTLDAVIDVGTGLLRFTIGGFTLSVGKGFGTTSQFIMWYGPTMAENLMSESDAVFYLKIDGSAYFGGTLLAGVLTTTAQTSDTSTTATIQIGDFASNGGVITGSLSYTFQHTVDVDPGTGSVGPDTLVPCVLESSTNSGGTWVTLATGSALLHGTILSFGGPKDTVKIEGGVSFTGTWTPGALTTLRLRAKITSRPEPAIGGTGQVNNVVTQNLAVRSTEEP